MRHEDSYLTETLTEIKRMVLVLVTLNEWEKQEKELKKQLQLLQEDYSILELAKAVKGEDETAEAKMQIAKLMREIEQCIALIQNL